MGTIGAALREAREASGRSIQEASAATRIRATYLEALEEERFDVIGGDVYARSFLRTYANYLGIDPAPLLEAYQAARPEAPVLAQSPVPIESLSRERRGPNWLAVGAVCAAILLFLSVRQLLQGGEAEQVTPVVQAPTTSTVAPPSTAAPTTTTRRGVELQVAWKAPSWIRVRVDGEEVLEGTINPPERRTFEGRREIEITLGNAPGVDLTVNGVRVDTSNASAVWTRTFGPGEPRQDGTGPQRASSG